MKCQNLFSEKSEKNISISHLTNILLKVLNVLLVYRLCKDAALSYLHMTE